jgi:cytochrome c5
VDRESFLVKFQLEESQTMSGKTAMWVFATLCTAAVAFGAVQDAPNENATMTDTRGEQILTQSCSSCHELRNIFTQALDKDGWSKVVKTMVERGATVKADDIPGFVDFLVRRHGPLPEGAGKKIVLNVCTQCHELERIRMMAQDRDEWEQTLVSMQNEGAPLSDDDFPIVLNYLARNFGPPK